MKIQRPSTNILTVQQAAQKLNVHRNTLRKMTKAGEIPAYKFGKRIVYRQDDLDSLIEGLEVYQPCGS
jgi:excisionase family DNA binding protein